MNIFKLSLLISLAVFFSCAREKNAPSEFNKTLYSPSYSSTFSIEGSEKTPNTLIKVKNPWQGAENISKDFMVVRDGNLPENFEGKFINGEARRIVCMSSTHVAMLDALDAADRIVALSGKNYVSSPKLRAKSDFIPDIGYDGNIDYETLLSVNPDLVLLFSINGASSMEKKLDELGIPYLYVGDYLEEDPLGKAEWLVAIGEIIGKRKKGEKFISDISGRYNSLKEKVEQARLPSPKVMLNTPLGDSWFMPSTKSYVAMMMKDAGSEYVYTKNTGNTSVAIDMEEAYRLVSEADFWLNTGTIRSMDELKADFPKFTNTDCVAAGNVYNNNYRTNSTGGNDCYESGVVNPDLILRDLIKIFHPELVEEDFVYYHRIE